MALVLTVESGAGLANANSYATVAEADSFFESRPRSDAWVALDDDAKAVLLVHATRIIDASMAWDGDPLTDTQALAFPRLDGDGQSTGIPAALKSALCEMALAQNTADTSAQPATTGFQSIEVGPIKIVADEQRTQPTIPRFIADLLAPFGSTRAGSGSVRLTRR
jgi:hypothetical protein